MTKEDSDEKFSFQIEGKDYIISKKSKPQKKDQSKIINAPSLAIGAVISGICIAVIIFGVENISDEPQHLFLGWHPSVVLQHPSPQFGGEQRSFR